MGLEVCVTLGMLGRPSSPQRRWYNGRAGGRRLPLGTSLAIKNTASVLFLDFVLYFNLFIIFNYLFNFLFFIFLFSISHPFQTILVPPPSQPNTCDVSAPVMHASGGERSPPAQGGGGGEGGGLAANKEQAKQLKEAGLTAYNHNLGQAAASPPPRSAQPSRSENSPLPPPPLYQRRVSTALLLIFQPFLTTKGSRWPGESTNVGSATT